MVKNPPANAGDIRDAGSVPGVGRSRGGERGNALQYSRLENPMDRGAWRASVPGATQSRTRLSDRRLYLLYACGLSHFSRVQIFATLLTVPCQAPLSMGFSRREYWSGLPCPPPGDLPDPGIEPTSLTLAGRLFTTELPGKLFHLYVASLSPFLK